jgi:hypothetical protein
MKHSTNNATPKLAVSKNEAGRMLSVSSRMVDKMIRDGRIVPVKLGKRTVIEVAELERVLKESRDEREILLPELRR